MKTITIQSAVQTVDTTTGDTLQLVLRFSSSYTGSNVTLNMDDYGIRVESWGKVSIDYDLEDNLLVPGTFSVVLCDMQGVLDNLFFGQTTEYLSVTKRAEVELLLNGNTEYVGLVQEDGINYDSATKKVTLTIDPNTQILTQSKLFTETSTGQIPVNQFGLIMGHYYTLPEYLQTIYRLIDSSITYVSGNTGSLKIYHDWTLWGERLTDEYGGMDAYNHQKGGLAFDTLSLDATYLFFDQSKGLSTLADLLKKLAIDWCAFTGLVHRKRAFFKKLYYYSGDTQTLGTVLSRKKNYRAGLIDYVEVEYGYPHPEIYRRGTQTNVEGRFLMRNVMPIMAYYPEHPAPAIGVSSVRAVVPHGDPYAGTYQIYRAYPGTPEDIDNPFSYSDNGDLIADFWYDHRSNIQYSRQDVLVVRGVGTDYLKDFTDEGYKYQIIKMVKDFDKVTTDITALFLGA